MKNSQKEIAFLKSALTIDNPFMPSEQFLEWMAAKNKKTHVHIEQIPFSKLKAWNFDDKTGNLVHNSGKFFSIKGIRVRTNWGLLREWEQPIIDQPEVGFLGILTKKYNGTLYFLMQAKIEPGNINAVQLSPTLQATRSNYTQVHKGVKPKYLDYFNGNKRVTVLLDQLQSEQGARFLKKRNRNIIIEIEEDEKIAIHDNFCWLTLGQIKSFLKYDNLVNMDTRTVISGISFGDYAPEGTIFPEISNNGYGRTADLLLTIMDRERHLHDIDYIISWITQKKSEYFLDIEQINLSDTLYWKITDQEIFHINRKYFSVIGVNVEIGNREVNTWNQPILKAAEEGIIAFIIRKIDGIYHFLVQGKLEAGNFDIIELAPTVQCLTGNYRKGLNDYDVPFLDTVLKAKPEQVWHSSYQSEEGGRFYKEQNKNMIIEVGNEFSIEVPENYIWMTLNQLIDFIKYNNYLNIAARSLISTVAYV